MNRLKKRILKNPIHKILVGEILVNKHRKSLILYPEENKQELAIRREYNI